MTMSKLSLPLTAVRVHQGMVLPSGQFFVFPFPLRRRRRRRIRRRRRRMEKGEAPL